MVGCQRGNQVYPGLFKVMFYFPNAKSTIWESIENIPILFFVKPLKQIQVYTHVERAEIQLLSRQLTPWPIYKHSAAQSSS